MRFGQISQGASSIQETNLSILMGNYGQRSVFQTVLGKSAELVHSSSPRVNLFQFGKNNL